MTGDALYHDALLRLARAARGAGRLEAPDGSATRDNPLCGDRVSVEVRLRDGRVAALAHRVRGCVLCEASASLLGEAAPGRTGADLSAARDRLAAMLRNGAPPPDGDWSGLSVFTPVRAVPSRHDCVLMPFDALVDALGRARG
ncbi:MAG TPA: iron-sulfur cluster assembly scaffold protein [Anaeromyxobacteraceae bacterium]|nr:iron-sulfur cluster assembly scaffold protein [Anaeromyxobacteraceae bacterium]